MTKAAKAPRSKPIAVSRPQPLFDPPPDIGYVEQSVRDIVKSSLLEAVTVS
jgi:hypothetical protein